MEPPLEEPPPMEPPLELLPMEPPPCCCSNWANSARSTWPSEFWSAWSQLSAICGAPAASSLLS